MKRGELRALGRSIYSLSLLLSVRIIFFFVCNIAFIVTFPIQIIAWLLSSESFMSTLPYHFIGTLMVGDSDAFGRGPNWPAYRRLLKRLDLVNSWHINHCDFVRIFILLRAYHQTEAGKVEYHSGPSQAPFQHLVIGILYAALFSAPIVLGVAIAIEAQQDGCGCLDEYVTEVSSAAQLEQLERGARECFPQQTDLSNEQPFECLPHVVGVDKRNERVIELQPIFNGCTGPPRLVLVYGGVLPSECEKVGGVVVEGGTIAVVPVACAPPSF